MKGSFATRVSGSSDLYRVSITTYSTSWLLSFWVLHLIKDQLFKLFSRGLGMDFYVSKF